MFSHTKKNSRSILPDDDIKQLGPWPYTRSFGTKDNVPCRLMMYAGPLVYAEFGHAKVSARAIWRAVKADHLAAVISEAQFVALEQARAADADVHTLLRQKMNEHQLFFAWQLITGAVVAINRWAPIERTPYDNRLAEQDPESAAAKDFCALYGDVFYSYENLSQWVNSVASAAFSARKGVSIERLDQVRAAPNNIIYYTRRSKGASDKARVNKYKSKKDTLNSKNLSATNYTASLSRCVMYQSGADGAALPDAPVVINKAFVDQGAEFTALRAKLLAGAKPKKAAAASKDKSIEEAPVVDPMQAFYAADKLEQEHVASKRAGVKRKAPTDIESVEDVEIEVVLSGSIEVSDSPPSAAPKPPKADKPKRRAMLRELTALSHTLDGKAWRNPKKPAAPAVRPIPTVWTLPPPPLPAQEVPAAVLPLLPVLDAPAAVQPSMLVAEAGAMSMWMLPPPPLTAFSCAVPEVLMAAETPVLYRSTSSAPLAPELLPAANADVAFSMPPLPSDLIEMAAKYVDDMGLPSQLLSLEDYTDLPLCSEPANYHASAGGLVFDEDYFPFLDAK